MCPRSYHSTTTSGFYVPQIIPQCHNQWFLCAPDHTTVPQPVAFYVPQIIPQYHNQWLFMCPRSTTVPQLVAIDQLYVPQNLPQYHNQWLFMCPRSYHSTTTGGFLCDPDHTTVLQPVAFYVTQIIPQYYNQWLFMCPRSYHSGQRMRLTSR